MLLPGSGPKGQLAKAGTDGGPGDSAYRGSRGLSPKFLAQIEKQFGFDKPPLERFVTMLWNYLRFDFGDSYFRDISVIDLILEKMPVSITLGLWMTLLSYGISIPLGIAKAVRDGSRFDVWTSTVIIVGYALPGFLIAMLLIVLFAGGSFWNIFPLRGLVSDNWASLPWSAADPRLSLAHHAADHRHGARRLRHHDAADQELVPRGGAQAIRGDGARQGADERQILYRHVFRNAMLLLIASFPAAFIGAFFGGSLLIETIFSLDGSGCSASTR